MFGCLCFSYIPKVKRDKLDKKSVPDIFIGYSSVSKAYKVFQPQTENIIFSRDVNFIENEEWCREDSKKFVVNTSDKAKKSPTQFFEDKISLSRQDEMVDHLPVKGTRQLSDIYQRCNVAVCELQGTMNPKMMKNGLLHCKKSCL